MPAPLFFVVWGTRVRVKKLGDRADYCPGCLQLCRFTVRAVEESRHI